MFRDIYTRIKKNTHNLFWIIITNTVHNKYPKYIKLYKQY